MLIFCWVVPVDVENFQLPFPFRYGPWLNNLEVSSHSIIPKDLLWTCRPTIHIHSPWFLIHFPSRRGRVFESIALRHPRRKRISNIVPKPLRNVGSSGCSEFTGRRRLSDGTCLRWWSDENNESTMDHIDAPILDYNFITHTYIYTYYE